MTKRSVMEEDWDNLIVLDACRCDQFEKLYHKYFDGDLLKVQSVASNTSEWLTKLFSGKVYEDVVYVLSNPMINSKGIGGQDGFDGRNSFCKVVDVWDWGWNEELGTVEPSLVNKAASEVKASNPKKRIIIHYMQLHYPYLALDSRNPPLFPEILQKTGRASWLDRISAWIYRRVRSLVGEHIASKLSNVGVPSRSPSDFAQKIGEDEVISAYRENLNIALKSASELVEKLKGKTVITSDHGELLGEGGKWGHSGMDHPLLGEVPWLEVKQSNNRNID